MAENFFVFEGLLQLNVLSETHVKDIHLCNFKNSNKPCKCGLSLGIQSYFVYDPIILFYNLYADLQHIWSTGDEAGRVQVMTLFSYCDTFSELCPWWSHGILYHPTFFFFPHLCANEKKNEPAWNNCYNSKRKISQAWWYIGNSARSNRYVCTSIYLCMLLCPMDLYFIMQTKT